MKSFAVLSDIHANLPALQTALHFLQQQQIHTILCLGDIIGYNAQPTECVQTIQQLRIPSIQGNHERYLLQQIPTNLPTTKQQMLQWTKQQLQPQHILFLQSLPETMPHGEDFWLVHGSPTDKDEYILSNQSIKKNLNYLKHQLKPNICFFGHTHIPMVIGPGLLEKRFHQTKTIELNPHKPYLINPGSIGQPRDKCPLTSFATFNTYEWSITIHRLPYNIQKTQEKILEAGLEPKLAKRLELGI